MATLPGPDTTNRTAGVTATPPALLEVRSLHAGYGGSEVLAGIDLAVGAGEIVGVLGRNGMGKTTLVRAIMGLLRPSAGDVRLDGRSLVGLATNRVARSGIAIVIDKYVQRLIAIGDRHCILEKGRGVWQGSSDALDADRSLWQRYLGV